MKLAFADVTGRIRRDTTLTEVECDQRTRSGKGIAPPANEQQAAQLRKFMDKTTTDTIKRIRDDLAECGQAVISPHTILVDQSFKKENV